MKRGEKKPPGLHPSGLSEKKLAIDTMIPRRAGSRKREPRTKRRVPDGDGRADISRPPSTAPLVLTGGARVHRPRAENPILRYNENRIRTFFRGLENFAREARSGDLGLMAEALEVLRAQSSIIDELAGVIQVAPYGRASL